MCRELKKYQEKLVEPEVSVSQTVKKNYATKLDYPIYPRAELWTKYNETVSSYIAEMVRKDKSQMKAHLIDSNDLISIIWLLAKYKLVCDTKSIQDWAAMWGAPHYVIGMLANAPNSIVCATNKSSIVAD